MTVVFLKSWQCYKPGEAVILPNRLARELITLEICRQTHVDSVEETH